MEEQICYTIALQNNFSTAGLRQLEVKGNLGDYCAELMRILPMCLSIAAFLLQLSRSPANNGFKSGVFFFLCRSWTRTTGKKSKNNAKFQKKYISSIIVLKNGSSVANKSYYKTDFGRLQQGQQMAAGLDVSHWVYLVDIIVKSIIEGQIPDILQKEWSISGQSTNSFMDHHHNT